MWIASLTRFSASLKGNRYGTWARRLMVQQAVEALRARFFPPPAMPTGPTLGLRGGLGKTLLISYLLLAIVPLSLLSLLTYHQIQRDTGKILTSSLETTAALKEEALASQLAAYEHDLALIAIALPAPRGDLRAILDVHLTAVQNAESDLTALACVDPDSGRIMAQTQSASIDPEMIQPLIEDESRWLIISDREGDALVALAYPWAGWRLVGFWDARSVQQVVVRADDPAQGIASQLVTQDGLVVSAAGIEPLSLEQAALSEGVSLALQGRNGSGAYDDLEGTPVFGAYRWNPDFHFALLVEQSQSEAMAAGDTLTAVVVGATLAVALITAAIAAVVTRRVTAPIVQLTETAAWMARGDLNQQVAVDRKDEIGILARAFNRMAAELRILYGELEAKVAERTRQLEEANAHTRYHVMQLAISAEVARIASSIRDLDEMLSTVVELLSRSFELSRVSVYLLSDDGQWAILQVSSADQVPPRISVGGEDLIGQVAQDGVRRVVQDESVRRMVVPLRVGGRVLGVLDLHSDRLEDFGENDQLVYQSLADQVSIAIENARAYALEHETVMRLRELDRIQSAFLTNMSHALRTPLNSIIGFSRFLLKELDGPLNARQRVDLENIYQSGRQLLGLINDMLDLSQLELGTAPFTLDEVDLAEIIEGVMATARALARGKAVRLYDHVPEDLPPLYTDAQRLRQVILALLSNAVKFTDEGSIHLRVTQDGDQVTISVSDTGRGLSRSEMDRIFADERGEQVGFGLAISKRVIERLGGQIWVESEIGRGSTFTLSLPLRSIPQGETKET
ncbi:MAG TPA: HAMP domain-containing protein [Anaerolineae bacterium]|nr:HAMP domain-containing protein [Anaerolineae bacterium]